MRGPDLERARSLALVHLAAVVDPTPTPATSPADDPAALAASGGPAPLEPLAVDASSLLPAAELFATLASAWVATKFGPSWMVTPERATTIGRALVRVVQKYLPSAESWGCEAELGIALGDWALAGAAPMLAGVTEAMQSDATLASETRP